MDADILKIRKEAYISLAFMVFLSVAVLFAYGVYDIQWRDSALYIYAVIIALTGGHYLSITLTAQYYWDGPILDIIKPSGLLVIAAASVTLLVGNSMVSAITLIGIMAITIMHTWHFRNKYQPAYERKIHQRLSSECREYYQYDKLSASKQQNIDQILKALDVPQLVNMTALLAHLRDTYGEDEDLYDFLPDKYK